MQSHRKDLQPPLQPCTKETSSPLPNQTMPLPTHTHNQIDFSNPKMAIAILVGMIMYSSFYKIMFGLLLVKKIHEVRERVNFFY